jgi:hypothetical protein
MAVLGGIGERGGAPRKPQRRGAVSSSAATPALTFIVVLGLTATLVLGALDGPEAKLAGLPLAVVLAWLVVRLQQLRRLPGRGWYRDFGVIGASVIVAALSWIAVTSSLASSDDGKPTPTPTPTPTRTPTSTTTSLTPGQRDLRDFVRGRFDDGDASCVPGPAKSGAITARVLCTVLERPVEVMRFETGGAADAHIEWLRGSTTALAQADVRCRVNWDHWTHNDQRRGQFAFRRDDRTPMLAWSYSAQRVVIKATGDRAAICGLWDVGSTY